MSGVAHPRGPLPPRIYWTRRVLLLAVVFALIFGVSRVVGGGAGDGPSARTVGAASTPTTSPTTGPRTGPTKTPTTGPTSGRTAGPRRTAPTPTLRPRHGARSTSSASPQGSGTAKSSGPQHTAEPSPAQPSGPCASSDVVVTPRVHGKAYAARPVIFGLKLRTRTSPACTWAVSARSLALKVTSGADRVWSTQQCPASVPKRSVVVRRDSPTVVRLTWQGQRSDDACSQEPAWAQPGYYHVLAAAIGADPVDRQFELLTPKRRTIVKHPKPDKQRHGRHRHGKQDEKQDDKQTKKTAGKQAERGGRQTGKN